MGSLGMGSSIWSGMCVKPIEVDVSINSMMLAFTSAVGKDEMGRLAISVSCALAILKLATAPQPRSSAVRMSECLVDFFNIFFSCFNT